MKKISIVIILILFVAVTAFCDEFGTVLRKAEQGNPEAQTILAAMYCVGKEIPNDYERAVYWYKRAAEQGYAKAQYNLGAMYDKGIGVPQNRNKAAYWYRKAAKQGHVEL